MSYLDELSSLPDDELTRAIVLRPSPWVELSGRAILEAASYLNLRHAPAIFYNGYLRSIAGQCWGARKSIRVGRTTWAGDETRNVIILGNHLCMRWPQQVSRTLWHELVHAHQADRDFDSDWDAMSEEWERQLRAARCLSHIRAAGSTPHLRDRYRQAPYEAEAERVAKVRHIHHPLTVVRS